MHEQVKNSNGLRLEEGNRRARLTEEKWRFGFYVFYGLIDVKLQDIKFD